MYVTAIDGYHPVTNGEIEASSKVGVRVLERPMLMSRERSSAIVALSPALPAASRPGSILVYADRELDKLIPYFVKGLGVSRSCAVMQELTSLKER
jgi:hypothetical protein